MLQLMIFYQIAHASKNTLIHIVNHEKKIFDKINNLKSMTWHPSNQKKSSNIFTSNNYLRNYLTSIIYVKEYFYMFFLL